MPGGYKILLDETAPRVMWNVFARNGRLIRYMPYPNMPAAIQAAEHHRAMSGSEQRAMEAKAEQDRIDHEAYAAAEAAQRAALARAQAGW